MPTKEEKDLERFTGGHTLGGLANNPIGDLLGITANQAQGDADKARGDQDQIFRALESYIPGMTARAPQRVSGLPFGGGQGVGDLVAGSGAFDAARNFYGDQGYSNAALDSASGRISGGLNQATGTGSRMTSGTPGLAATYGRYADPELAGVYADPNLIATQQAALDGFMRDAEDGGLESLKAQAQFEEMNNERANRAMQDAVLQNMEQRGMQGSGTALMGRLSASQGLNQARAAQSLGRQAQGFQNRQQALTSGADLSSQMRDTGFGEETQRAKATDVTNAANTDLGIREADNQVQGAKDLFGMRSDIAAGRAGVLQDKAGAADRRATEGKDAQGRMIGGLSSLFGAF